MNLILLRKIRKSLNSRRDIYWNDNIFLTRREFSKFWTTERILRAYIDLIRSKWLKRVGCNYHWEIRHTNRYEFTDSLQEFFNQMFPIIDFKALIPSIEVICRKLRLIYRPTTKNYIISENKERKITFNTDLKVFTVWSKTWWQHKWYNYFTGMKLEYN